jgi:NOL1/NOP2/fmu family ribosome biogenesis protein
MKQSTSPLQKIRKNQVKELLEKLETYHVCSVEHLKEKHFYMTNKGKVYISGHSINLSEENKNSKVEGPYFDRLNSIGMYFGTYHDDNRFRLSIEGTQLLKPTKNYILLKDKNALKAYLAAENIVKEEVEEYDHSNYCPFLITIFEGNNLGSVSPKEGLFLNYVPKARKVEHSRLF